MATNTFTHANGLVIFDWFDAGNWSLGVPAAGADVLVNYAPGFGYTIGMGVAGVDAGTNPPATLGTLTLDTPDATLQLNTTLSFATLDLKAGTITNGFNAPAPVLSGGTVLAEGGHVLGTPVLFFNNVTWLGDVTLTGAGGGIEFTGTTSFGPLPGGARPAMTLGRQSVTLRGTQTLSGIDVFQTGTSSLTFGELSNSHGVGTIAGDVTFTSTGDQDRLVVDDLTNLGRILVSAGSLSAGPVLGNALLYGDQGSFINGGTI